MEQLKKTFALAKSKYEKESYIFIRDTGSIANLLEGTSIFSRNEKRDLQVIMFEWEHCRGNIGLVGNIKIPKGINLDNPSKRSEILKAVDFLNKVTACYKTANKRLVPYAEQVKAFYDVYNNLKKMRFK